MSLESREEKDASELVHASLTLADQVNDIVSRHLQASATSLLTHQPASSSLQGTDALPMLHTPFVISS